MAGKDTNEVSSEAISQMVRNGQIREIGGGHKGAYISRTVSQIDFKLGQNVDEGVPYY